VTVDAHVHVWDPATRDHSWLEEEPPAIRRPFRAADLAALTASSGVGAVVLVQVVHDLSETREFLALAASGALVEGPAAVVGWVDLEAPDVADTIAALRESRDGAGLAGIRHLIQAAPDDFLYRPAVRRGLAAVRDAGLVFDLCVREWQLAGSIDALEGVEGLRIVLDHGAKPLIAAGELDPWRANVARLAAGPLACCKLSGLMTEAGSGWSAGQIRPYAEHLLDCFGPGRLCFGSDWPVCTAYAGYAEVLEHAESFLEPLAAGEREAILDGNARRIYQLPAAVGGSTGRGGA
jgi:L-fuconolactonase